MKKSILTACRTLAILFVLGGLFLADLLFDPDDEVLFQSMESKTTSGMPVYNKVKFMRSRGRDVWMMNQGHEGPSSKKWDRLAIVVEEREGQREATFLQLPPRKLEWTEDLLGSKVKNRVSCFMCHSNGPRAIRFEDSIKAPLKLAEKARILLWNFRIKSYGLVRESPIHEAEDPGLGVPFRHRGGRDNEVLGAPACMRCHSSEGFLSRGPLTRQNSLTIDFMVRNGFMPPPGFSISEAEKKLIRDFVDGF